MTTLDFTKTRFIASCLLEEEFPTLFYQRNTFCPEVAILGRSNVGKSSLINHLTQQKHLARTSSTPGKTARINFFSVENKMFLVDLPGYGFSQKSKDEQHTWSQALDHYIQHRKQLACFLCLFDLRRALFSKEDLAMLAWIKTKNAPAIFVFTKCDKLTSHEQKQAEQHLLHMLQTTLERDHLMHLCYSIKDPSCRLLLKNLLTKTLNEFTL